jgi:hypothetical protein
MPYKPIHGQSSGAKGRKRTPTYVVWSSMKSRCLYSKAKDYPRYGGRGITICEEWIDSFPQFYKDMGEKPVGHTIDRIDNDGSYCPENCRWATPKTQSTNKRNTVYIDFHGTPMPIKLYAEYIGLDYKKFYHCYRKLKLPLWKCIKRSVLTTLTPRNTGGSVHGADSFKLTTNRAE